MRSVAGAAEQLRAKLGPMLMRGMGEGHAPQALLLVFGVAVLAGIWLTTAWIAVDHRREIYASATSELTGAQSVLRSNTERTYELVRSMLAVSDDWLSKNAGADSAGGDIRDLAALIQRMQYFGDQPVAVRFVDENGYLFRIGARDASNVSIFVGDRDYFQLLKDKPPGSSFVGPALISRDSGNHVLPVVMRAHLNRLGVGYIVAAVPASSFSTTFAGLLISAPSEIGFVRDDGVILLAWPSATLIGKTARGFSDQVGGWNPNHFNNRIGSRILPSPDGAGEALVAYARLKHEPITVFATFNAADLEHKWWTGIYALIGSALFTSLIVILLAHRILALMQKNRSEAGRVREALVRAEAANLAKKNFLANMSHELRTPLNAVIGFSEVISSELLGPVGNPTYKTYASDITNASKHLLEIIKEILDLARIDAGTFETGTHAVSVAACVTHCVTLTQHIAEVKQIAVETDLADDLPHILCDPTHIRQVVLNIVGNAIKFTPKNGRVTVSARLTDAGTVTVIIADTGIGIPGSKHADLFKPFSQVAGSFNRSHDGLGLGLAYSKRIMDAYGGRIALQSEVGRGTTVTITFPSARVAQPGTPEPASPAASPEHQPSSALQPVGGHILR